MAAETFPIDLRQLRPLKLDPKLSTLTDAQKADLRHNIQLCRDTIVFFTALAGAKGLSGHTGGAYDTVPEMTIIRAFIANGAPIVPVFYDEAGHRVATQYLLSVLEGAMPAERLLHYREFDSGLPGHPEKMLTPGVEFSSGRLGHMWAFCNGVAMANPGKAVVLLGSDGSQMEGDDAEAARLTVAQQLNIKVLIDDNNVTIAGHPQEYMTGYDLSRTLAGYGLTHRDDHGRGPRRAVRGSRAARFHDTLPRALVIKRPMAPGIDGAEGSPHAHEVLKPETAIGYLEKRGGYEQAIAMLKAAKPDKSPLTFQRLVRRRQEPRRLRQDHQRDPRRHERQPARRERARSSTTTSRVPAGCTTSARSIRRCSFAAASWSAATSRPRPASARSAGRQGIFATFSAFLEMCVSEITMARLNFSNVLAHFSHSGVDDMADNTCHFGINSMFADGGLKPGHGEDTTRLYFPVDQHQFAACVKRIFTDPGLRFVFTTRAPVPDILDKDGKPLYQGKPFEPGKDYIVREAPPGGGYVVAMGETVYRALDAVIDSAGEGRKGGAHQQADAERGGSGGHEAAREPRPSCSSPRHGTSAPGSAAASAATCCRPASKGATTTSAPTAKAPAGCGSKWAIRGSIPPESSKPCRRCSNWIRPPAEFGLQCGLSCNTDENDYHLNSDPHYGRGFCILPQPRHRSRPRRLRMTATTNSPRLP